MNLRDIKKDIEYVVGAFVDDCALFLTVNPGKNADEHYNAIRKEMLEKTDALYDELSQAVKKGLDK